VDRNNIVVKLSISYSLEHAVGLLVEIPKLSDLIARMIMQNCKKGMEELRVLNCKCIFYKIIELMEYEVRNGSLLFHRQSWSQHYLLTT